MKDGEWNVDWIVLAKRAHLERENRVHSETLMMIEIITQTNNNNKIAFIYKQNTGHSLLSTCLHIRTLTVDKKTLTCLPTVIDIFSLAVCQISIKKIPCSISYLLIERYANLMIVKWTV